MAEKAEFIRIAMQECGIGRKKAECLYVCGMRYLPAHETLHQRLNETDAENDRLRAMLSMASKGILRHQAEQPMSLRIARSLTKIRTDIKKALENKHEQQ